jgi:hypothetical protein
MMTPAQVQKKLDITWDVLFAMIKTGQIISYCIHGTFRFKPVDVAACKPADVAAIVRASYVASFNPCDIA